MALQLLLISLVVLAAALVLLWPKKKVAPLPPGPKPLPIVGNIKDLPQHGQQEWLHWSKHKDLYGPISSVTVLGQTIVIINEAKIAIDLMEKRSALHSSRPRMVFGGEMCGWKDMLATQAYNDRFRAYRKPIHQLMGSKSAAARFHDLQITEVGRFLFRILEKPDDLVQHIRAEAGAIILKIAYGYTIEPHSLDPLVAIADEALEQFSLSTVPGAWMVDIIPGLMYLPDWFPGTGFKKTARHFRKTVTDLVEKPFKFVKQQMEDNHGKPQKESYLASLLEKGNMNLSPEDEFVAKWTSASLYSGGADTTVSTITCFFLAMTIFPSVQRKAQEEIDRVIGTHRLPNFEDRENLPYINAIVKEALRWHPVGPMSLPHLTTSDDVYNGYLIPKGALVVANIWQFTHDPDVYPSPELFFPDRFLGPTPEPDPHNLSFGFGRRICPGRVLADESVYLVIAQGLAVFNIEKPVDPVTGKVVEPVVDFCPGIISHPRPFGTKITPRSQKYEDLVRQVVKEHPWEVSDAGSL